jgi:hypothetical protein
MNSAYKHTTVHWGKSQAQIMALLEKQGVQDIRFTFLQSNNQLICEFNFPSKLKNKDINYAVRITIPVESNDDKFKNQIHRALFYYLKTKFEALNFGLIEFAKEFMPHLVITDKSGNQKTIHEIILPQYENGLIAGEQKEIKMLPE